MTVGKPLHPSEPLSPHPRSSDNSGPYPPVAVRPGDSSRRVVLGKHVTRGPAHPQCSVSGNQDRYHNRNIRRPSSSHVHPAPPAPPPACWGVVPWAGHTLDVRASIRVLPLEMSFWLRKRGSLGGKSPTVTVALLVTSKLRKQPRLSSAGRRVTGARPAPEYYSAVKKCYPATKGHGGS